MDAVWVRPIQVNIVGVGPVRVVPVQVGIVQVGLVPILVCATVRVGPDH